MSPPTPTRSTIEPGITTGWVAGAQFSSKRRIDRGDRVSTESLELEIS